MQAIGPIIRLDNDDDFRPIMLFTDWDINEKTRIVHHVPTKLTFIIDYKPPTDEGWVKASDLTARLAHTCDGCTPNMDQLCQIGKDAIHAFFLVAEACQKPTDDSQIPF